ncbi:tRNA (adenosine(37)-N6)-threonylcarbamoyltransferase complex dimerization subunit type 1 TsaB [bacterium]|nr:tRNA (adenosine(37)-N6)-threonylcarbamoyltransferase complex dimerization subunit type 1 TsaB [bacterium]
MKILAIETSTPSGSVALAEDTLILWECTLNSSQTHSETLIMNIHHGLKAADIKKEEIECIAVTKGPGSFTGLRIGMTTAKILAFSLNIPIVSVSSLLAYAYNFSYMKVPLCPMLDARKNEVYAAIYEYGEGNFTTHLHDGAYTLGQVLKSCPDKSLLFGNGAELYKELILSYDKTLEIIPSNLAVPRASSVAILGYWKFMTGEHEDTKSLTPNYCRKSEAEILYKNK